MAFNYDRLVKWVKSNPEGSQKAAADAQGIGIGELSMMNFCRAKVDAGVVTKAPGTAPSVKKLRDNGDRWELIAARVGKGVSEVKNLYEEAGGDPTGYVGKGRNFGATPSGKQQAKGKPGRPKGGKNQPTAVVRNRRRGAANPK